MTTHLPRALNASVLLAAALLVQPHAGGHSVSDRVEIDVRARARRSRG